MTYFLGTMSGTSLDGLDVVLTAFAGERPQVVAAATYAYPPQLLEQLTALCSSASDEIERMLAADIELGRFTAESINELLAQHGYTSQGISAIGHHGQTIRHRPDGPRPNTLQIGDANTVTQGTGITTVADFRRRDMAAGGQGAPLVPAFHRAIFHDPQENRVIVNIGGIANITLLQADPCAEVIGFDSGPGNVLMDGWYRRHHGTGIDNSGRWADSGQTDRTLLRQMMGEEYFQRPYPKSTGREGFHQPWLDAQLQAAQHRPEDVQATLSQLTAESIMLAIRQTAVEVQRILVCGGGVHNLGLMRRLQALAGDIPVHSTHDYGIDPDWVEGACFAWLARQTLAGLPGNLPSVTGAQQTVILGAIYQA